MRVPYNFWLTQICSKTVNCLYSIYTNPKLEVDITWSLLGWNIIYVQ